MSLSEIIFRLFAWVRPLLWYYHRLSHFLEAAIRCLEDDDYCLWLFDTPSGRAAFESKLVDGERCLDIAIGLRVREILGLAMPVTPRLGIGGFHRIHSPPSLERLAARLDRLVDRYNDIERLAQLRAARIRREIEAAPVLLEADHRPDDLAIPNPNPTNLATSNFRIPEVPFAIPVPVAIRGPPGPIPTADADLPPASQRKPARTRPMPR